MVSSVPAGASRFHWCHFWWVDETDCSIQRHLPGRDGTHWSQPGLQHGSLLPSNHQRGDLCCIWAAGIFLCHWPGWWAHDKNKWFWVSVVISSFRWIRSYAGNHMWPSGMFGKNIPDPQPAQHSNLEHSKSVNMFYLLRISADFLVNGNILSQTIVSSLHLHLHQIDSKPFSQGHKILENLKSW